MGFPSEKEVKRVRKLFKDNPGKGSLGLASNPTPLQQLRFDLCQKFIGYARQNELSQKDLAKILEIDAPKMSKILHHRIEEFSTDRLIELYSRIDPNLRIKMS